MANGRSGSSSPARVAPAPLAPARPPRPSAAAVAAALHGPPAPPPPAAAVLPVPGAPPPRPPRPPAAAIAGHLPPAAPLVAAAPPPPPPAAPPRPARPAVPPVVNVCGFGMSQMRDNRPYWGEQPAAQVSAYEAQRAIEVRWAWAPDGTIPAWTQAGLPDCGACALLMAYATYFAMNRRTPAQPPIVCKYCHLYARPDWQAPGRAILRRARDWESWLWHMTSRRCNGLIYGGGRHALDDPSFDFSWPANILDTARYLGFANSRIGFDWSSLNQLKVAIRSMSATSVLCYPLTANALPRELQPAANNELYLALVAIKQAGLARAIRIFFRFLAMASSFIPIANNVVTPLLALGDVLKLHYVMWDPHPNNQCFRDPHGPWDPKANLEDDYVDTGIRIVLAP